MRARLTAEAVGTFALVFAGAVVAVPVCRPIADPTCCTAPGEDGCA